MAPPRRPSSPSRSRKQQKDRGRVEKKSDSQDEPTQHGFVVRTEQRRQIAHRAKIGLDGASLAFDRVGLLDPEAFASTVSLSARLLRSACRCSSSAARSLEIGDALKVMAPN